MSLIYISPLHLTKSAKVEIAVLLNELPYMKYEASSSNSEAISLKIRNLTIAFSLVEKVVKLISNISEEGGICSDDTFTKVISGLNETLEVVLEYLKDAKDHGHRKGDDLLASARVAGRGAFSMHRESQGPLTLSAVS